MPSRRLRTVLVLLGILMLSVVGYGYLNSYGGQSRLNQKAQPTHTTGIDGLATSSIPPYRSTNPPTYVFYDKNYHFALTLAASYSAEDIQRDRGLPFADIELTNSDGYIVDIYTFPAPDSGSVLTSDDLALLRTEFPELSAQSCHQFQIASRILGVSCDNSGLLTVVFEFNGVLYEAQALDSRADLFAILRSIDFYPT